MIQWKTVWYKSERVSEWEREKLWRAFYIHNKYKEYVNCKYWYGMHSGPCHAITTLTVDGLSRIICHCFSLAYSQHQWKYSNCILSALGCVYMWEYAFFFLVMVTNESAPFQTTHNQNATVNEKKPNQPYKSCSRLHLKPLTSIRVDEEKWVFRAKKNVKSQTRQRQNSERLTKKYSSDIEMKCNGIHGYRKC